MAVELTLIDEDNLETLLRVAADTAEPDEVMPPVEGPPGWTAVRVEAFRAFHRERFGGMDNALRTSMFAVVVDGEVAGMIRMSATEEPDTVETGMWLGRGFRGQGLATAALLALLARAGEAGARTIIANTTPQNAPALATLRRCGAALVEAPEKVYARIPVPQQAVLGVTESGLARPST